MTSTPVFKTLALATGALMLSGCMSIGLPDGGGQQGGQYPGSSYPSQGYPQQGRTYTVAGAVDATDPQNQRFMLIEDAGNRRTELVWDGNTVLTYRGQQLGVEGLERGDRIRAQVMDANGRVYARSIEVTQNVRGEGPVNGTGSNTPVANTMTGAVTFVDTANRTIGFTRGGVSGSNERVRYDYSTWVEYQNRRIDVGQIYNGDVIKVIGRANANGEFTAEQIIVEQRRKR